MAQLMTVAKAGSLLRKAKSARELMDFVGVKPHDVKANVKAAVKTGLAALVKAADGYDQRYAVSVKPYTHQCFISLGGKK